jgi:hypothetical protein
MATISTTPTIVGKKIRLGGAVALLFMMASMAAAEGLTLHVATNGNDQWSGRIAEPKDGDGPFLTLERARDAIRQLKKEKGLPAGGVTVEVHGGSYALQRPLELTAEDSGTENAPIVYQAKPKENVRISGGVEVTNFQPVTDPAVLQRLDESARGKVFQADLKALGIKDLSEMKPGPSWAQSEPGLELFFQDTPMTLARWPNEGFVKIPKVAGPTLVDCRGTKGCQEGMFLYEGDRPSRWVGQPDVMLQGYWFWDWADQRLKVESIDVEKHMISLQAKPVHAFGFRAGQWYYAYNILSELDQPGEWYLDREKGMLYFWPTAPLNQTSADQNKAVVSVASSLITADGATHLTVRGFTLEACRNTAVVVKKADAVHIVGCTIRNVGGAAVSMAGKESGVEGCDIYATAHGGIGLSGGDRKTLTPAHLAADNNHIHHYSRWNRMYQAAISLNGVGNRATHNLIYDAPHQAMNFGGNDHLIEFNEIHSVCFESNDAGAIYSGRNWTMRGTVIRNNYLHDITGFRNKGCVGIYLDDQFSGVEMSSNLFYNVTSAAFVGGGRDCEIVNNCFVDCRPAVHIDGRGLNWAATSGHGMFDSLAEMPYKDPLWASRYPKLATILEEQPMAPKNILFDKNIIVGARWLSTEPDAKGALIEKDNLFEKNPGFVDAEHLNFQLKDDSPAFKMGFQRIPLEKIGLYESPNRASWPVQHAVRPPESEKSVQ